MGLFRSRPPAAWAGAPFTYAEVGATRDAVLPAGYTTAERSVVVGRGAADHEAAAAAVFGWAAQRSCGLRVRADGPATREGTVVVLTAGLFPLGYDIPCRVVWAQAEGDERGFAYGTLPGHPESGEESFVVRLTPDGDVLFTLRVFYRLASPAARLVAPASRVLQAVASRRYLSAIRRATRSTRSAGTGRP
ncbi:DUF1990 family protein [Blastococcus sp. SYSU D00820]